MTPQDGYLRSQADEARAALTRVNETVQALSFAGVATPPALIAEQQRLAALVTQTAQS